jgi:hypothetical protein
MEFVFIYEVTMLEAIIVKQNKLNQCSLSLAKANPSIDWARFEIENTL